MSNWSTKDAFTGITVKSCIALTTLTAAGSGDATEVDGTEIDCLGFDSISFLIVFSCTLQATKTMVITGTVQHVATTGGTMVDAGTSAPDYQPTASEVVATSTAGGTVVGVYRIDVNRAGLNRFMRIQVTPDLNASGTDVATIQGVALLGGADALKAQESPTGLNGSPGHIERLGFA